MGINIRAIQDDILEIEYTQDQILDEMGEIRGMIERHSYSSSEEEEAVTTNLMSKLAY